jgi:hypothetical protein
LSEHVPNGPDSAPTIWERLGFRDDPYATSHLPVAAWSEDLFVGREPDRNRLTEFLRAYPTGWTMVEGRPGVGKTSFVNVVLWELFRAGQRFPLGTVVEVPGGATREAFLLTVLSALVESCRERFGEDELKHTRSYLNAEQAVSQIIREAGQASLSASAFGVGGGFGRGRSTTVSAPLGVTANALLELLRPLVQDLRSRGFGGVVVPVNNLDVMPAVEVISFLNSIRDITRAVADVHWVFIGSAGLFGTLEREMRRLSETFTGNPIVLAPLEWNQVQDALERRRRYYALEGSPPLPISEAVSGLVHEAGGGELRFTLARLGRTALDFAIRFPSERQVPDAAAVVLLREWAERTLAQESPLAATEDRVAQVMAERGTLRARDFLSTGLNSSQRLSAVLGQLERKGWAVRVSAERESGYRLSGAAQLLLRDPGSWLP